jgi:hypothetical protein
VAIHLIDRDDPPPRPSCLFTLGAGAQTCMTRTLREVAASGRPVVIA